MNYNTYCIDEICTLVKGTYSSTKTEPGEFPLVVTAQYRLSANTYQLEGPAVCIPLISSTGHGDAALHRVHYQEGKFALANLLVALLPIDPNICYAKYLFHLFMAKKESYFVPLMLGTANVSLKIQDIAKVNVPLPPLEEQRRIVARIEEVAAKIEEARGLRREAVEDIEALHSSFLSNCFDKLTVKGILKDILIAKPQNGWSTRCDNLETGTPILSLGAITGFHYKETEYKRTSEVTFNEAHYWLKPGDLLITRSNTPDLVGHAAIYNGKPSPCIYPDLVMRLEINEEIAEKRFVHHWLRSNTVRDYIKKMAKGTSQSMKKISQEIVMNIPFPLQISRYEQRQITEQLNQLDAKILEIKQQQAVTSTELNALLPSILDKAFKGEL